jgi:hypothetical protein
LKINFIMLKEIASQTRLSERINVVQTVISTLGTL